MVTDREALARVEAIGVDFHRALARLPGARWIEDAGLTAVRTRSPFSGFNVVLRSGGDPAAALVRAQRCFRGCSWTWWAGDEADPQVALAVDAGFSARTLDAMYGDLRAPPVPVAGMADVDVVAVQDAQTLHAWIDVVSAAWTFPPWIRAEVQRVYATLALGETAPWRCLLAREGGAAVAALVWLRVGDGAGVFASSTVPHARGRRLAQIVGAAALADARAAGCSHVVAQTEPGGTLLAERLGLRRVGRLHILVAPPDAGPVPGA